MDAKYGVATIEKVAINAVLAGCLPEYFPAVLTAVEALLESPFNLYAVQTTTHPCAPLLILNGPIAKELGVNGGYNAFGQGWRPRCAGRRCSDTVVISHPWSQIA